MPARVGGESSKFEVQTNPLGERNHPEGMSNEEGSAGSRLIATGTCLARQGAGVSGCMGKRGGRAMIGQP